MGEHQTSYNDHGHKCTPLDNEVLENMFVCYTLKYMIIYDASINVANTLWFNWALKKLVTSSHAYGGQGRASTLNIWF